ncbi:hypothetical protein V6N11_077036 [Hibiscus sabdariffa]|uniref:Uncharacterized protein n=1 Tax=Hibiscus sabdariffa TaxID=183260 RepID=A0ABR2TCH7_9ROSI
MGDNQICAGNEGASSTWVKHDEGFRRKKVDHNKLQLKDINPVSNTIGEGSKVGNNELQAWDDSLKTHESTRQADQDKACQIRRTLLESDTILGLSKDPGFQGIIAEWPLKIQSVCQNKTNALCLSGGFFPWNRSLKYTNQFAKDPTYNKGKKIVGSSEGEGKDNMEDLVSDYLQGLRVRLLDLYSYLTVEPCRCSWIPVLFFFLWVPCLWLFVGIECWFALRF